MMTDVSAGDLFIQSGVGMYVEYELDAARDPTIERWRFSTNDEDSGHDGDGRFEIRVHEIVKTEKSGTLAVYHRQWFAPDNTPLGMKRRKISGLSALCQLIRRRRMVRPMDLTEENLAEACRKIGEDGVIWGFGKTTPCPPSA